MILLKTSRLTGAAYLATAQAVLLGLGYITHVLVGRLGGPSLYGTYGIALAFMTIINMLLTLGIPVAASKRVAEDEENSGGVFLAALRGQILLATVLTIGTLIAARPVALLLGDESLSTVFAFTAIIYPLTALYALVAQYFNGLHAFAVQAILVSTYAVIKMTGSVGLLYPFGVHGALSGFAIGGLIAGVIGLFLARDTIRTRIQHSVPIRSLITFGGTFVGIMLGLQVLMSLDLFFVKRILEEDVITGYYTSASMVARIPYFIFQGVGFVFLPSVAQLMQKNVETARSFIGEITRYLFLLLLPITVIGSLTSKGLIGLFFSEEFSPAIPAAMILIIALGLLSVFYLFSTVAAGAGKARVPLLMAWGMVIISAIAAVILIPLYDLQGAAIATLIAAAIGAGGMWTYIRFRFAVSFPVLTLIRGIVATAIIAIPTVIIPTLRFSLPILYIALGIIYVLSLVAMNELHKGDIARITSLMARKQVQIYD